MVCVHKGRAAGTHQRRGVGHLAQAAVEEKEPWAGGWKSQLKVLASLGSSGASLLSLQMAATLPSLT